MCLRTETLKYLMGEAAVCGARLLAVLMQVEANLWQEDPSGGLPWGLNPQPPNRSVCLEVQALPLSHVLFYWAISYL